MEGCGSPSREGRTATGTPVADTSRPAGIYNPGPLLGRKIALDSLQNRKPDTTYVDAFDDTVWVCRRPWHVLQLRGGRKLAQPMGDSLRLQWQVVCQYDNQLVELLEFTGRCQFRKTEQIINNYQLRLQCYAGSKLKWARTLDKRVVRGLYSAYDYKRLVLLGAEPVAILPGGYGMVWVLRLGEYYDASWWQEAWVTLNDKGKVVRMGRVDDSPNCGNGLQWSASGRWLLTCSELADLRTGQRRLFNRAPVVMTRLLADSVIAVVYAPQRVDTVYCDSLLTVGLDTFPLRDVNLVPDTSLPNVYIHAGIDATLAELKFIGTLSRLNYTSYLSYSRSLKAVGFYRPLQKTLRIIRWDNAARSEVFPVAVFRPAPAPPAPLHSGFLEFDDSTRRSRRLRFYFDKRRQPLVVEG